MKDYLNSEERQQVMYIFISHGIMSGILETNRKNMSKGEITALKYITTHIEKYFDALLERVGKKEIQRICRESEDYTAVIKPRKHDGFYTIDKNALEEIARMAVEANCFGCKKEDFTKCELYKYMKKAGMGRVDETPKRCDYYYEKEEEETNE